MRQGKWRCGPRSVAGLASVAITVAGVLPGAGCSELLAQEDSTNAVQYYHYEPWPLTPGSSVFTLGLSLTMLPEPVIETEVPAPAVEVQFKLGLTRNSTLVTTISTNIFSNILQAGIQWNDTSNRFSYAIGNNLVGFFGWFTAEGQFHENWAWALGTIPLTRFGFRFEGFSLSATLAASLLFDARSHVGTIKAAGASSPLNDIYLTLAIEQPFLRNGAVSVGFSITYSRSPYQSWILFNTIDQFLLLPEFFVGFQL
jgi:hypothetical protein